MACRTYSPYSAGTCGTASATRPGSVSRTSTSRSSADGRSRAASSALLHDVLLLDAAPGQVALAVPRAPALYGE